MVSALVMASSVNVAFIRLEAIVDLVALIVPLASPVGPRNPMDMSQGAGSAVWWWWYSDCSGCDLVPSPLVVSAAFTIP